MCAEKENNEDFSQGFFFYNVHRKRGPLMTSYSSQKSSSQVKKIDLNDFKQNPDITYFTYFKKSADLAT